MFKARVPGLFVAPPADEEHDAIVGREAFHDFTYHAVRSNHRLVVVRQLVFYRGVRFCCTVLLILLQAYQRDVHPPLIFSFFTLSWILFC